MSDKLEISLYVSTTAFACALAATFAFWYFVERTLSIRSIVSTRRELFYWAARRQNPDQGSRDPVGRCRSRAEAAAAADWHALDRAIDRALEALRATTPDSAKCKQAITELLTLMDSGGKS
jgi:hypothetical protein